MANLYMIKCKCGDQIVSGTARLKYGALLVHFNNDGPTDELDHAVCQTCGDSFPEGEMTVSPQ